MLRPELLQLEEHRKAIAAELTTLRLQNGALEVAIRTETAAEACITQESLASAGPASPSAQASTETRNARRFAMERDTAQLQVASRPGM